MLLKPAIIELITHCSGGIDPLILQSLIRQESANHPYAIHDGQTHRSHFPKTREEAIQLAKALQAKGHRLDIGLAQINTQNFKWLNLTIETAFNPCTNLKASSTVLKDAMQRTPDLKQQLSIYNSGKKNSEKGLRYANAIIKRAKNTSKATIGNGKTALITTSTALKHHKVFKTESVSNDGFTLNKALPMSVMLDGFSN